jgi:hypothetical protein
MHMDARLQGLAKDLLAKPDTFMLSFDLIDETTENPAALCEGINAILASTESSIRATLVEDNDNGAVHMVSNQHTLPLFPPPPNVPNERPFALPESFHDAINNAHPSTLYRTEQIIRHQRELDNRGDQKKSKPDAPA